MKYGMRNFIILIFLMDFWYSFKKGRMLIVVLRVIWKIFVIVEFIKFV